MNKIVLGAFFGDEGKGQTVNNLIDEPRDTIVVRFSGAHQVGHNVVHNGIEHCFRSFGSGTLKGCQTYWSKDCLCEPYLASKEYDELVEKGVTPQIVYHPQCQIILPIDAYTQREDSTNMKHGTCGSGYKKALDRAKAGWVVTVTDATNKIVLEEKVRAIYEYYYKAPLPLNLDEWIEGVHSFIKDKAQLRNTYYISFFKDVIFEGSQGILLDQTYGVMPYCTPSNTTSKNIFKEFPDIDTLHTETYYVCRPYITRHGNGPMLTDKPWYEVNDKNNPTNPYQGKMRGREFDIDLLKHSLDIDDLENKSLHNRHIVFSNCDAVSTDLVKNIKDNEHFYFCDILGFEFENWKKL